MTKEQLEKALGRPLPGCVVFENKGTFGAYYDAEDFCRAQGYSVGRMCSPEPTGIKKGEWDIQKWRNLSAENKKVLDGALVGNFRTGPVTLFFEGSALEQLAECAE